MSVSTEVESTEDTSESLVLTQADRDAHEKKRKREDRVRIVIAASEHKDLTAAAKLADKLVAMTPPTPMAVVQAQQPLNELQEMREEIARLAETVSASHASRRAQTITEPNTPLSQEQHEHICWYHRRFGSSARKCVPACAHSGNSRGRH
ncbi:hypothetical protein MRX96_010553 [Rhipicephalus microplus]